LDNAGKYSQPGSDVTLSAHVNQDDKQFEITAKNLAMVTIERKDIPLFGERGFRSEMAKRRTAEGSGIGLFLVKMIMLAHQGNLRVDETDPLGFNRVTITIPI
jgi:signal transduction histidine kinase